MSPRLKKIKSKTFSSSFTSSFGWMSGRLSIFLMVYLGFRTCPLWPVCPDVRLRNDQNLIGSGSCGQRSISRSSFSISQFSSLMVRGEKQYRNKPKSGKNSKNLKNVQILKTNPKTVWAWKLFGREIISNGNIRDMKTGMNRDVINIFKMIS